MCSNTSILLYTPIDTSKVLYSPVLHSQIQRNISYRQLEHLLEIIYDVDHTDRDRSHVWITAETQFIVSTFHCFHGDIQRIGAP